ncbi:MAG: riboflavin synthase [Pseudomonadota bacterium]|nr:riboflavin synthase [Pseudomonadota bacterium]
MFTGIIESQAEIVSVSEIEQGLRICVSRPPHFNDIKTGDSIAVDGICLTVETHNELQITFCLAPETLLVTEWNKNKILGKTSNLERSLCFGNRIHGHLVSGHIEGLAQLVNREIKGESQVLTFEVSAKGAGYLNEKGCVALNGVSLTVNRISGHRFQVCLIPETLKRTNLVALKLGDNVNFEADYLVKNQRQEKLRPGGRIADINE